MNFFEKFKRKRYWEFYKFSNLQLGQNIANFVNFVNYVNSVGCINPVNLVVSKFCNSTTLKPLENFDVDLESFKMVVVNFVNFTM